MPNIPGLSSEQIEQLRKAAKSELSRAPQIAIIGETGVGKTSTINAMFNSGLETSHVRACTQESKELEVPVSEMDGVKGTIKIFDMPGLGEDLDADERHKATYKRVLSQCDVAVWVLDGTTRTFTPVQLALKDVVGVAMGDLDRLVIGINKIDQTQPGEWVKKYNLPSPEQEKSITEKIDGPRSSDRPLYAFITSAIGERPQYNLLKINILNFSGILPYALISH